MLVLFNKPYGVLSQFTSDGGRWQTLAAYITIPDVYAAGRLDADSEGLLLLTDNGALQAAIAGPQSHVTKTYWAQVEGVADTSSMAQLKRGVTLNDGPAKAVKASLLDVTEPWPRDPPIRVRKSIPDSWIELCIDEGRNRQVRRMTAAVGLPTLRLIRVAVGPWRVEGLALGQLRTLSDDEAFAALRRKSRRQAAFL
ncbi:pseudouridine synthase [Casimicrobium huifangae]|uniref:pseudouridine synthase n=1 Tax=Casimicrobium huifangae TaxID=2591109 RepID=UPI003784E223